MTPGGRPTVSRIARLRRFVGFRTLAGLVSFGLSAHATGSLGRDGTPIRTSSYTVDLTQTPVLASARVTGLAGAYVAIAEGIDGNTQTPVAPAVRTNYSLDHFDYEIGLGLTLPATLTSTDFFNTGRGRTQLSDAKQQGFVFITPALNLVWGNFGVGATLEISNYTLRRSNDGPGDARIDALSALFLVGHLQAAQAFAKGQLTAGIGLRVIGLDLTDPLAPALSTDLFTTAGAGLELGALYTPHDQPYRIGAAFRSPVSTRPNAGSYVVGGTGQDRVIGSPADPVNAFWIPDQIAQPWDLNVGLAVQVGPRPLNPDWNDPEGRNAEERRAALHRTAQRAERGHETITQLSQDRAVGVDARSAVDAGVDFGDAMDELHVERIRAETRRQEKLHDAGLPRRYLLISMSLVVTGPLKDAVGVESFLQRVVDRSGTSPVYSPRLGLETELIPYWLKVRGGTYGEPTRFATSSNRLHATLGFDVKVFPWTVFKLFDDDTEWRISTSGDAAPRYLGWGVSVGVWH